MKIDTYRETDLEEIIDLFYDTVHTVNAKDYSQEQLDAWAPRDGKEIRKLSWQNSLRQHMTYVVRMDNKIVGFGDLTDTGYLDRLFVHKDYQSQGIATALLQRLEAKAKQLNLHEIHVDASITAKPFFEHHGYQVIREQTVERQDVTLTNYHMVKQLER